MWHLTADCADRGPGPDTRDSEDNLVFKFKFKFKFKFELECWTRLRPYLRRCIALTVLSCLGCRSLARN